MMTAHEVLGIPENADTAQIQAAYRSLVKRWHPDVVADPEQKKTAQDKIVAINLAYESALHDVCNHQALPDAKKIARQLILKKQYEAALRVLSHGSTRDAEWFYLQGLALLKLRKPAAAHDSFRAAIRMEPANAQYRSSALEAAIACKKRDTVKGRMGAWARTVFLAPWAKT